LLLSVILDSNGLDDTLWVLRAVTNHDREIRLYAVWCARQVQHLVTDRRSIDALDVAEQFAKGEVTEEQLSDAWAAWAAARSDAWATARPDAWYATARSAAESAAWYAAARAAARSDARSAAESAAWYAAAASAAASAASAARAAARAARAAARAAWAAEAAEAAWADARAAAESAQKEELLRIISGGEY
jgi:hypothetical protein